MFKLKLYVFYINKYEYTFKGDYHLELVVYEEVIFGPSDTCSIKCTLTCKVS